MNARKIVIYTAYPHFPRLETELEIADKFIEQGDEVLLISCMGGLATCFNNRDHNKLKCLCCNSRLKAGYKWIGEDRVKLKKLFNITRNQQARINKILKKPLNNWDDLRSIQVDGDDVGEAAFSEVVSNLRETNPNLNDEYSTFAKKLLENSLIVHFSILNHLLEEKPDIFILFNGRIAAYRPALRIGVMLGINTLVFEVHSNYNKYNLVENTYPHDPIASGKRIKKIFDEATQYTETEKYEIASEWYFNRFNGVFANEVVYVDNQRKEDNLEIFKDIPGLKVGIFISSEDEMYCIPEWKLPFYRDQNDAVAKISDSLSNDNIIFIVRAHPNLSGLDNTQIKELKEICYSRNNIQYIPPDSRVNSYELIDICDIILVFGSRIGIESVFKGKPTILMGRGVYRGFGGTIEPASHEDLVRILRESADQGHIPEHYVPDEQAMRHAATIYAFASIKAGIDIEYQKLTSHSNVSWIEKNGVRSYIKPHIILRGAEFLYRIISTPIRLISPEKTY